MTTNKQERATEIGRRLRELRGIRTRAGVARAIGVSYAAMCYYESGQRIPPDDVKMQIADYYGKTVSDIFYPEIPQNAVEKNL